MLKVFIPFALANNIYEIEPEFYKKLGVEILMCDLDNTLEAFDSPVPSEKAKELIARLQSNGLKVIVISNNTKKRVSEYCKELNCEFIYSARKPLRYKSRKYFKEKGLDKSKCIYIGDQVFTDVLFANRFKVKSILCNNLVDKDLFITKINKFFDRSFRKRYEKKSLVKNWKEL